MREIISLNENWTLSFPKGERPTEQVTLPHTWNAVDGICQYKILEMHFLLLLLKTMVQKKKCVFNQD